MIIVTSRYLVVEIVTRVIQKVYFKSDYTKPLRRAFAFTSSVYVFLWMEVDTKRSRSKMQLGCTKLAGRGRGKGQETFESSRSNLVTK